MARGYTHHLIVLVSVFTLSVGSLYYTVWQKQTPQRILAELGAYIRPTRAYKVTLLGQSFAVRPRGVGSPDPVVAPPVEPPPSGIAPSNQMEAYVLASADEFGVDRALALAMMGQESGGNPNAVSPVGATGLMQVMPATAAGIAADLGVSSYALTDPQTNARFGIYYFARKLERYQSVDWALAAYNWGPGNVDAFLERHPEAHGMAWSDVVATWGGEIPLETQNYIASIVPAAQAAYQQPQQAPQPSAAQGVSAPISVDGSDFGINVRAALTANGGALQHIVIEPGASWSFNETIGDPSGLDLRMVGLPGREVIGGGWCDLASRYVQALRPLLPPSSIQFPLHGVALSQVSYEDSVVIWSNGTRGGQDLIVTNTTDLAIIMSVQHISEDQVVITATTQ